MDHTDQTSSIPAILISLLFTGGLVSGLFFNGEYLPYLSATVMGLLIVLGIAFLYAHKPGIRLPATPVLYLLLIFWLWTGCSVLWSAVPNVTVIYFWWVGALPLAFMGYTLTAQRKYLWPYLARMLLLVGLAAAIMGLYQWLVLDTRPLSTFTDPNVYAAFLSLVALPAAGYFLLSAGHKSKKYAWMLGTIYFILVFSIALTNGRAANATFWMGLAVIIGVAWKHVPRLNLGTLFLCSALGFAMANLLLQGDLVERVYSLLDPVTATSPRLLIWKGTWEMIKDHPLLGTGLGTYWLLWPPYRLPDDSSGGYYAHNDYLQLWVETGLPGLVLFMAFLVFVLRIYIRALTRNNLSPAQKIELSALFAGLLAIAIHSVFSFNLYILPILLLSGLLLGRFHEIAEAEGFRMVEIHGANFTTRKGWNLLVILLFIFPLSYMTALGLSAYYNEKARNFLLEGDVEAADLALIKSEHLTPSSDIPLITRALIYRAVLLEKTSLDEEKRRDIYTEANNALNLAQDINPYRSQVFFVRGLLLGENPDFSAPDVSQKTEEAYKKSIHLDPRNFEARLAYATFMAKHGEQNYAFDLLKAGVHHWYYPSLKVIPYYSATAAAFDNAGDKENAEQLRTKIKDIIAISTHT